MLTEGFTKCPVCTNVVKWENYSSSWGTEEEYITCPICGYRFQYSYGNYFEEVSDKCFTWDCTITPLINPKLFKEIKRAKRMARRRWKKYKKGK